MHRRVSQVEQQLVEQRGAGGIERVVAFPLGQLLHQFEFGGVAQHFAQHRQQRRQQARAVGGGSAQLQFLAVFQVPFHGFVAELAIELLAAIGKVVIAGNLHAGR
ncbi:hypothetical protein D3C76_1309420 [compost metagenome]